MPISDDLAPIREFEGVTLARFRDEILPAAEPAVLRNAVAGWPLVERGRQSPQAIADYLGRFDKGALVPTVIGRPETGGRMFYRPDMSGFNFQTSQERLTSVLKGLVKQAGAAEPPMIAMQSLPAAEYLPGIDAENPMPLLPAEAAPRLWIGNAVTVAPHFDSFDNIACVVAGRRRFILFPPEQVANLYVGPIDFTPAGAPISMVPLTDPDLDAFPRYRDALAAAQCAELAPGDAIFVPYMWWHGVRSLDRFNVLVNYWWNDAPPPSHPFSALLHASLLLRDVPDAHRRIWRHLFDHYVFAMNGVPLGHLRPEHRGSFGDLDPAAAAALRERLAGELEQEARRLRAGK